MTFLRHQSLQKAVLAFSILETFASTTPLVQRDVDLTIVPNDLTGTHPIATSSGSSVHGSCTTWLFHGRSTDDTGHITHDCHAPYALCHSPGVELGVEIVVGNSATQYTWYPSLADGVAWDGRAEQIRNWWCAPSGSIISTPVGISIYFAASSKERRHETKAEGLESTAFKRDASKVEVKEAAVHSKRDVTIVPDDLTGVYPIASWHRRTSSGNWDCTVYLYHGRSPGHDCYSASFTCTAIGASLAEIIIGNSDKNTKSWMSGDTSHDYRADNDWFCADAGTTFTDGWGISMFF